MKSYEKISILFILTVKKPRIFFANVCIFTFFRELFEPVKRADSTYIYNASYNRFAGREINSPRGFFYKDAIYVG